MARHKKDYMDEGSSSSEDERPRNDDHEELEARARALGVSVNDLLDEEELYEDPMARKRQRRTTKEDAIYGVFNEDNEDEKWHDKRRNFSERRVDQDVKFVGSTTSRTSAGSNDDDVTNQDFISLDAAAETNARRGQAATFGGLGFHQHSTRDSPELESERPTLGGGLGVGSGGMGHVPAAFGKASARESHPTERKRPSAHASSSKSDTKVADWSKHTTGIGLKLLQKMGYKEGSGLGEGGQGIARPIETKLRPGRMGISFGGFKEKTTQAREEEKRRGFAVSSDEEEAPVEKRGKPKAKAQNWKKKPTSTSGAQRAVTSKRSSKVTYRTVDEVIAEAEYATALQGHQTIVDYTGQQVRTITSTDIKSTPTGQAASTRFMELRHNLDLLVNMAQSDVARYGREKRLLLSQEAVASADCTCFTEKVTREKHDTERLRQVQQLVNDCQTQQKQAALSGEHSMNPYRESLHRLYTEFTFEFQRYRLDRLVVALLAPSMRHVMAEWQPLEDPSLFVAELENLRPMLITQDTQRPVFGAQSSSPSHFAPMSVSMIESPSRYLDTVHDASGNIQNASKDMTAYESLLQHVWLPRIRSSLNNDWNPRIPEPAIALLEQWRPPLIPRFMFESVVMQVIIPKLRRAIDEWQPRRDPVKLHVWLHPWLPLMAEYMDELWTTVRHRYAVVLQQWHPSDVSALDVLSPWQGVFRAVDMEALLSSAILPKLTMAIRMEFEVNPQQQDLAPLEWVLAWLPMLPTNTMAQLLEKEFFPKWLNMLTLWLQGEPNYDQVTEWYLYWKGLFPEELREHPRIQDGFRRGLDLMNQMIA